MHKAIVVQILREGSSSQTLMMLVHFHVVLPASTDTRHRCVCSCVHNSYIQCVCILYMIPIHTHIHTQLYTTSIHNVYAQAAHLTRILDSSNNETKQQNVRIVYVVWHKDAGLLHSARLGSSSRVVVMRKLLQ